MESFAAQTPADARIDLGDPEVTVSLTAAQAEAVMQAVWHVAKQDTPVRALFLDTFWDLYLQLAAQADPDAPDFD